MRDEMTSDEACAASDKDIHSVTVTEAAEGAITAGPSAARIKRPPIGSQPCQRSDDALSNRRPGLPAQGTNLAGVEVNQRAVSHPTAIAARIFQDRIEVEVLADPANGLIDRTDLIGTEIENIYFGVGAFDGNENAVDAIRDGHIGFSLQSIAENLKFLRIRQKFLEKIEEMTMRISFAKDRDKTQNPSLKTEPFTIRGDQPLASEFRCTVERCLNGKWCVLRCRDDGRVTIDRPCR